MRKNNVIADIEMSDIGIMQYILKTLYGHKSDELATSLINRFGGVGGVFRATRDELVEVDGVTERVATFFAVALPAIRRALLRDLIGTKAESESMLVKIAAIYFMAESRACDVCVLMDVNGSIKRFEDIYDRTDIREFVGVACKYEAERLAWLRFVPDSSPQYFKYSPKLMNIIRDLAIVLDAAEIEFVDRLECYPYSFRSLRSVLHGDETIKPSIEACNNLYDKTEKISELLNKYKIK